MAVTIKIRVRDEVTSALGKAAAAVPAPDPEPDGTEDRGRYRLTRVYLNKTRQGGVMLGENFPGSGWRVGVVITEGGPQITILDVGTLRTYRAPRGVLRSEQGVGTPPARLAKLITRRAGDLKRLGVPHAAATVKRVAAEFRRRSKT